jgi:ketosteroid isomerase-like protein
MGARRDGAEAMPSDSENLRIVREIYEAFGKGDLAAILNLLAGEVDWAYPGPKAIPFSGSWHGRDRVAQFFAAVGEHLEVLDFGVGQFIAQGDAVVVLGRERMRVKGTGRVYETEWAHVYTLREGKVVRFREYANTAAVAQAFRGS